MENIKVFIRIKPSLSNSPTDQIFSIEPPSHLYNQKTKEYFSFSKFTLYPNSCIYRSHYTTNIFQLGNVQHFNSSNDKRSSKRC